MDGKIVIYQSRRKAMFIAFLSPILAIVGWLFLQYVGNTTAGWCFIILSGLCLLYGMGIWYDRKPYLILTEKGITEMSVIREEIEWEAIRRVSSLYFRGQFWVCILIDRNYKPGLITPAWFYRLDRLYASENVKAVYIRLGVLEIGSACLIRMINELKEADPVRRKKLLQKPLRDW